MSESVLNILPLTLPKLIRRCRLAKILGVSPHILDTAVGEKILPRPLRLSTRTILFDTESVRRYIDRQQLEGGAA